MFTFDYYVHWLPTVLGLLMLTSNLYIIVCFARSIKKKSFTFRLIKIFICFYLFIFRF